MFFIFSFSVENITWVTKNLTSKVSPGIIYCIQNVSKKSKVNIVWVSYYNLSFTTVRTRVRTWILVVSCQRPVLWLVDSSDLPIKGLFLGRKLYLLELMSWLRSQKNLICELQALCYEFRKNVIWRKAKFDMTCNLGFFRYLHCFELVQK